MQVTDSLIVSFGDLNAIFMPDGVHILLHITAWTVELQSAKLYTLHCINEFKVK